MSEAALAERRFEAAALGRRIEWKYGGQVVPENRVVVVDVEITALGVDGEAVGRVWLWVDGLQDLRGGRVEREVVRSGVK